VRWNDRPDLPRIGVRHEPFDSSWFPQDFIGRAQTWWANIELMRDEDHTRGFLDRHQNKILFGSDCDDHVGMGPKCSGSQTIAAIRKLATNKAAERKILFENAKNVFRGLV